MMACGEDDSSSSADSVQKTSVKQTVTMIDWVDNSNVAGVELCWAVNDGEKSCMSTNDEGVAEGMADVAPGDILYLSGSKDGYYPFKATYEISDNPTDGGVTWSLVQDAIVDLLVGELGEAADATKGHATVLILQPNDENGADPIAGASVTMTEGTASKGPNYTNLAADIGTSGLFNAEGVTTAAGIAVYNNVNTGMATLKVSVEGKTCTAGAGLATGNDNEVRTDIEAGVVSYTTFICQ
jgi:hypothetical protein